VSKNTLQRCILTANRLADGAVVFLDFEGAWNTDMAEALVAHTPDEIRALEDRGAFDATRNLVVEPYLAEVREIGGRIEPLRYRERVRAGGPTILDDVPGYLPPSPHRPSRWEESLGEGAHPPEHGSTPHPSPPPAGAEREHLTEAA
jgi:hypothetical protein